MFLKANPANAIAEFSCFQVDFERPEPHAEWDGVLHKGPLKRNSFQWPAQFATGKGVSGERRFFNRAETRASYLRGWLVDFMLFVALWAAGSRKSPNDIREVILSTHNPKNSLFLCSQALSCSVPVQYQFNAGALLVFPT